MIKQINFYHSLIFFNFCIIISAFSFLRENNLTLFCLFLILTVGISHGALDNIVPASNLLDAKDFLIRNKVEVETHLIDNCDHHIPIKSSSIALNYIIKNFSI